MYELLQAGKQILVPFVSLYYEENDVPQHEIENTEVSPELSYLTAIPVVIGGLNRKACFLLLVGQFLQNVDEQVDKGTTVVLKLIEQDKYKVVIVYGSTLRQQVPVIEQVIEKVYIPDVQVSNLTKVEEPKRSLPSGQTKTSRSEEPDQVTLPLMREFLIQQIPYVCAGREVERKFNDNHSVVMTWMKEKIIIILVGKMLMEYCIIGKIEFCIFNLNNNICSEEQIIKRSYNYFD